MSSIKATELLLVTDLFERLNEPGYVLDFSNRTYSEFFAQELNVDIDDEVYSRAGTSKMKRLRCYLQTVSDRDAVRALQTLWGYREALRERSYRMKEIQNAKSRFEQLVHRLGGPKPQEKKPATTQAATTVDQTKVLQLSVDLVELSKLAPQPRGYAFEKFLKDLFDAYGMEGRDPFRLHGEQIDGSFLLGSETYLLEAKWQNAKIGAADLHAFNGKLENKAAWTRGLFVSQAGFTDEGLAAFGKGKRVVCMDGLDLYETLSKQLPLDDVLFRKVRRMSETGYPFARVRELF